MHEEKSPCSYLNVHYASADSGVNSLLNTWGKSSSRFAGGREGAGQEIFQRGDWEGREPRNGVSVWRRGGFHKVHIVKGLKTGGKYWEWYSLWGAKFCQWTVHTSIYVYVVLGLWLLNTSMNFEPQFCQLCVSLCLLSTYLTEFLICIVILSVYMYVRSLTACKGKWRQLGLWYREKACWTCPTKLKSFWLWF